MVLTLTTSHVECPAMLPDSGAMTAMLGQATGRRTRVSMASAARHGAGGIVLTHGRSRMDGSLEALGAEAGVPMAVRPMLAGIRQVGR